jgi:hypothetical protein
MPTELAIFILSMRYLIGGDIQVSCEPIKYYRASIELEYNSSKSRLL